MRSRLAGLLGTGTLMKQVITIMSGTASAQVLTVIAMIPLARVYTPKDFGLFAIIQSVVTIGVTLAALRYDLAVVLPRSDLAARVLFRLASNSIAVTSALLSVTLVLIHPWISKAYCSPEFAVWLVGAGIATYLMAQIVNVQYWLNRKQDYRAIAGNRLIQAIAVAVFQLGFAPILGGFRGLLSGLIVGQAITLILVRLKTPELRAAVAEDAPTQWEMAKKYRKMPLVNGPTAVFDAIKSSGINVLIGNIALSGLGQYTLAYQMTKAPVSLLNGAVAQVLLQRLSTTKPGGMARLLRASFWRISLLSIPAFAIFYFVAPFVFPFVFGAEWAEAGLIAQALVPWLFMMTFTSPLSSLFVVANKQEWGLLFAAVSTACALTFLVLSPFELQTTVFWLALLMSVLLMLWVVMALLVARGYDRSGDFQESEV